MLNLTNHHSDSPPNDNNGHENGINNTSSHHHHHHHHQLASYNNNNINNNNNGHNINHNHISFSNPNSNNPSSSSSSSSSQYNSTRAPYKRSDKFNITRQKKHSGNGYSSLSTKSVNTNKTKFDFSSVKPQNSNDMPPSNRRFRTISPRIPDMNNMTKTTSIHSTMSPLIDSNNISLNAPSTPTRIQFNSVSLGTSDTIQTRSRSNPNILGTIIISFSPQ